MLTVDPRAALATLASPAAYEAELQRLVKRHSGAGRHAWIQEGLALADWNPNVCRDVARTLARSVASGEYRLGTVTPRRAHLGGKERVIYRASITDTAVVAVLARVLRALTDSRVSGRVFSYRPGRSALRTVREFAEWVRAHRQARPDPRTRGLFVLRRDVTRYGDSIPVHDGSPLWPLLDATFEAANVDAVHPFVALVREAIRPRIQQADASEARLERGVPTGSAIQPVICNLYLSRLDRALESIPDGFYARFGDDILFAHADPAIARRAADEAAALVVAHELEFKAEKTRDLFFNGSGRSAAGVPGATAVDYLGLRVAFTGAVGLPKAKARRLLREVGRRVANAAFLAEEPGESRALPAVCGALGRALDPKSTVHDPLTAIAQHAVDDRGQLRHLDYLIALRVAERLARARGVRAFRKVSYERLRRSGLPSLLYSRNAR